MRSAKIVAKFGLGPLPKSGERRPVAGEVRVGIDGIVYAERP